MTTVIAAIIQRDSRILIGQRKDLGHHPLKWEFPGGKVEPGETPEAALIRELQEELGIHARIDRELMRYEYQYPGKNPIALLFFRVTAYEGEILNLIYREMRWEPRAQLAGFDFVEGDRQFIAWFSSAD